MRFFNRLFLTLVIMTGIWVTFIEVDAYAAIKGLQYVAAVLLIANVLSETEFSWVFLAYKFINYPLRKHYESREKNYRDVIKKGESQLYQNEQPAKENGDIQGVLYLNGCTQEELNTWHKETIEIVNELKYSGNKTG